MYVKRTVRKRGDKVYIYLSLVEAVRIDGKNTQRELLRLGEVSDLERTGQLDRIVAALELHRPALGAGRGARRLRGAGHRRRGSGVVLFRSTRTARHFAAIGEARGSKRLEDTVLVMVANRLLDPSSKRRTILQWLDTVALPESVSSPTLDQCYRGLDAIREEKEATEELLYPRLTDLTNLDLRLALTTSPPPTSRRAAVHQKRSPPVPMATAATSGVTGPRW